MENEDNKLHPEYNYWISNMGSVYNQKRKRLSPKIDKDGYEIVGFSKNNQRKYFRVHRLVAEMFMDKFNSDLQINHINGIKNDNRIENLELVTSKQNHIHRVQVLKIGVGDNAPNRVLTKKLVEDMRIDFKENKLTQSELQKKYGVTRGCVYGVLYNKSWKI